MNTSTRPGETSRLQKYTMIALGSALVIVAISFSVVLFRVNSALQTVAAARVAADHARAVSVPASTSTHSSALADLVRGASSGRATYLRRFAGPDRMIGIVYRNQAGAKQIAFASPDAELLFPGPAIDAHGTNITQRAIASQHLYADPAAIWRSARTPATHAFTVGRRANGIPHIVVFMDPNCIFCHLLYKKLMPRVQEGQVRATFVMVGFLKASSIGKAATILASRNPTAALAFDEGHFDVKREEGGIVPVARDRTRMKSVVEANTALMGKLGPIATPTLLVCASGATTPSVMRGAPRDLGTFIGNLNHNPDALCNQAH